MEGCTERGWRRGQLLAGFGVATGESQAGDGQRMEDKHPRLISKFGQSSNSCHRNSLKRRVERDAHEQRFTSTV